MLVLCALCVNLVLVKEFASLGGSVVGEEVAEDVKVVELKVVVRLYLRVFQQAHFQPLLQYRIRLRQLPLLRQRYAQVQHSVRRGLE